MVDFQPVSDHSETSFSFGLALLEDLVRRAVETKGNRQQDNPQVQRVDLDEMI